jgi:hypothetical protein
MKKNSLLCIVVVEKNIVITPIMPQTYLISLLQRINNSHYKLKNIWDVLKIIMLILIMPTPTFSHDKFVIKI